MFSEASAVNRFLMFPKTAVRLKQAGHLDYNAGDLSVGHTPAPLHAGQKSRPNQPGKKKDQPKLVFFDPLSSNGRYFTCFLICFCAAGSMLKKSRTFTGCQISAMQ